MAAASASTPRRRQASRRLLMMENRSFDHMLGYLQQDGLPDGGRADRRRAEPGRRGQRVPGVRVPPGPDAPSTPLGPAARQEPRPLPRARLRRRAAHGRQRRLRQELHRARKQTPRPSRGLCRWATTPPSTCPVYDYLARNFCVCDAWHSSIPGDTWPNRLYSLAGREADPVGHSSACSSSSSRAPRWHAVKNAPIYDVPAFTRQLDDEQWRWYSHDPATLRAADGHYRDSASLDRDNFAYFDRKTVSLAHQIAEAPSSPTTASSTTPPRASCATSRGSTRTSSTCTCSTRPRTTTTRRRDVQRRPGAGARRLRGAGQQPALGRHRAGDRLRRARRVLRPRHAAAGRRRRLAATRPRRARAGAGRRPAGQARASATSSSTTPPDQDDPAPLRREPDQATRGDAGARAHRQAHRRLPAGRAAHGRRARPSSAKPIAALHKPRSGAWKTVGGAAPCAAGARSLAPDGAGHPLVPHDFQRDVLQTSLAMRKMGLPAGRP